MHKLTITISSRALFDTRESHKIYLEDGLKAYNDYQLVNEDEILEPGVGFGLVEKILNIDNIENHSIEVILISKNSSDSGLRIFNSIEHYGLNITRAVFTDGNDTNPYVAAFESDLFLSSNPDEVQASLANGYAAATILDSEFEGIGGDQLRLAFDGDAVIFSDQSEKIYKESGLQAFQDNENNSRDICMEEGPFKNFLEAIQRIQSSFPREDNPIRTALVTARGAPSHARVIKTMRKWGIRIDESIFLGGMDKGIFLKTFGADLFFDDHRGNCNSANLFVPTGHVPMGVNS